MPLPKFIIVYERTSRGVFLCLFLFFCILFSATAGAQDFGPDRDSLVRLIEAKSIKLTEIGNSPFRIVNGPARFLHNNTYLLCDSAAWDVNANIIDAMGHVQIIQKDTYLTSDFATYIANENLVQFRGTEVKLFNKKGDQLKTRFLDYNTADSVATFFNGGAMRSSKGDVVEGLEGMYDAADKLFMFNDNVNMFSDSIFIVSDMAEYHSQHETAIFGESTTAWKGRDTLFSNNVEYSVNAKMLVLKADNYIAAKDQELWAGWIDYHRQTGNAELYDNVQIRDQAQSAVIMGDKGVYVKNPMLVYMTDNAVAGMYSEEKTGIDSLTNRPIYKRDTLFIGGDTLRMWQLPMYQVNPNEIAAARQRRSLADTDPMVEIDRQNKQYLDAYKRNKELIGKVLPPQNISGTADSSGQTAKLDSSARQSKDFPPFTPADRSNNKKGRAAGLLGTAKDSLGRATDSLGRATDSLGRATASLDIASDSLGTASASLGTASASLDRVTDSLGVAKDSVQAPVDSTAVTFISVFHKVKLFRSDLRGSCDSLIYTTIDSIARFYRNPVLWNEDKNQFTADSIQLSVRNNQIYKANLIERAFIISQEDSIHFHQIKSTEMVAYFKDNDVYRFDALGGVQAMIFLRERDSSVTLMNQKECKLMTARIVNQNIERVRYIQDVKSDVIPTYKLDKEKKYLRDFKWRGDEMPKSRNDLTTRKVHNSERGKLSDKQFPQYYQTRVFFPESYRKIIDLSHSITRKIREEDQAALEEQRAKETERAMEKDMTEESLNETEEYLVESI